MVLKHAYSYVSDILTFVEYIRMLSYCFKTWHEMSMKLKWTFPGVDFPGVFPYICSKMCKCYISFDDYSIITSILNIMWLILLIIWLINTVIHVTIIMINISRLVWILWLLICLILILVWLVISYYF